MTTTTWTVVIRRSKFAQFNQTGFAGSWSEASDHARGLMAQDGPGSTLECWLVPDTDTTVCVGFSASNEERHVRILPTPEQRRAAKVEADRVIRDAADIEASFLSDSTLIGDARVLAGVERDLTRHGAAIALATAGFDRRALNRRHS